MIKQIKDTARAGVTLVELLVVILIVAILAVTMLPMFKKYVVQAQYAAEPIPLVGHIRTQIGLYQYENNSLPGGTNACVFGFAKNAASGSYDKMYGQIAATGKASALGKAAPSGVQDFLADMDISINELSGKKISPDQVFYALVLNDAAYEYAIGVFGKKGGLPENTGYAVLEAYIPNVKISGTDKGYKVVATWKNYSGDGVSTGNKQILFDGTPGLNVCNYIPPTQISAGPVAQDAATIATVQTMLGNTLGGGSAANKCGSWEYQKF